MKSEMLMAHRIIITVLRTFQIALLHSESITLNYLKLSLVVQGGSNMTGTDLCVNKPHCAAAVRP